MELAWSSATHVGVVRAHNEDAVLARPPIFLVADGMGGHAAGEVASATVVETFAELVDRADLDSTDVATAVAQANTAILLRASANPSMAGMGTTAVGLAAVVKHGAPRWLAFNMGDSRLYRAYDGHIAQITVDHSYVQELVDAGTISPADARSHPERSVVTRVLGSGFPEGPDFWLFPPTRGERFLLCSDGLSNELPDEQIRALLTLPQPPAAVAELLVSAALESGGRDNITVVIVDVLDPGTSGTEPDDAGGAAEDADLDDVAALNTQPLPTFV